MHRCLRVTYKASIIVWNTCFSVLNFPCGTREAEINNSPVCREFGISN